jgi:hypothetical protein
MILNYVTDSAGLVVKSTSALHSKLFRHRNLHALDMIAIPEGLQKRIGKTKKEHVVDWSFSEIMVDPKDRFFVKDAK